MSTKQDSLKNYYVSMITKVVVKHAKNLNVVE